MRMPIQLCGIAILIVVAGKVITLNENHKNDKDLSDAQYYSNALRPYAPTIAT
jgi:hypothetical protein